MPTGGSFPTLQEWQKGKWNRKEARERSKREAPGVGSSKPREITVRSDNLDEHQMKGSGRSVLEARELFIPAASVGRMLALRRTCNLFPAVWTFSTFQGKREAPSCGPSPTLPAAWKLGLLVAGKSSFLARRGFVVLKWEETSPFSALLSLGTPFFARINHQTPLRYLGEITLASGLETRPYTLFVSKNQSRQKRYKNLKINGIMIYKDV